jgi:CHAT domain-containing protein
MYEPLDANGDYLVLRHPFFRSITGIRRQRNPISRRFLNHLWREKEALRVLLVASDVPSPSIPVVDREVEMLKTLLREVFTHQGIAIQPEVLHTDEASYARVKQELHRCKYHIFHYAGHSSFDIDSPEKSFLLFWEKSGRRGDKKRMPSSELQMLLKESETRFVYFSSCSSAAVGTADNYLDDDFLGIMDGVICAGVPATLGYRWPIIDPGAESLARKFYSSLAEHGRLDTALLYARREVAGTNRDDITWLSPVLILQ